MIKQLRDYLKFRHQLFKFRLIKYRKELFPRFSTFKKGSLKCKKMIKQNILKNLDIILRDIKRNESKPAALTDTSWLPRWQVDVPLHKSLEPSL